MSGLTVTFPAPTYPQALARGLSFASEWFGTECVGLDVTEAVGTLAGGVVVSMALYEAHSPVSDRDRVWCRSCGEELQ